MMNAIKNISLAGWLSPLFLGAAQAFGATQAINLANEVERRAQPKFAQVSHEVGVDDVQGPNGRWAFRFRVTKSWCGELPQWPSVNLKPTVTDWSGYDRLVMDVYNDAIGGDTLMCYLSAPTGRLQDGLCPRGLPLGDYGYARWTVKLDKWPATADPKNVGRLHLFMTTPDAANVLVSGFYLLKPGETPPPPDARFVSEVAKRGSEKSLALRRERRRASVETFVARCRAAGQSGDPCWIGQATGMENVRPREVFDVAAATSFSLSLARGEYESLQVLVMPNGRDLANVRVEVSDLVCERRGAADGPGGADTLPATAFKTSPVGYVETVSSAPYKSGYNVATNLPGGYHRAAAPNRLGWWADPILDYLDRAAVKGDDLQSFWVRLRCPDDQRAGTYAGTLTVRGDGWSRAFPLRGRVYGVNVPKSSPLPLAITFGPGPNTQFADDEQLALGKRLRNDPESPVNAWKRHRTEWCDFLADHYLTIDSLYHSNGVHWDLLQRLRAQGRLGRFNLGYWTYPKDLSDRAKADWTARIEQTIAPAYAKAKELGLLDHAYLYGCDEVHTNFFPNIRWALSELKRKFPGVPLSTTAYDRRFGVGSPLADMDWFTPTTDRYEEDLARVPASRAAGHQVWWYIACGQKAPRANLFVEGQAIEARQLMGAQTVKFRPDGFLYYQVSIWNSLRCISGTDTFTDWNPKSWTSFHGDGSWFCCGPDGAPCATIRMENFRDGLEDTFYAREFERLTGKACEVPPEICRSVWQYTDDPKAYYAWRNALAEAIEAADAMRTPELKDTRLEGPLAEKMNRFLTCRIVDPFARQQIFDEAYGAFAFRDDDLEPWNGGWRGEFWGKTMLSAARVAAYLDDAALKAELVRQCRRLMATVDAKGYIGSYADMLNVKVTKEIQSAHPGATNWNLWNRKYMIWGLYAAYRVTGEKDILDAAERQMAQFVDMVRENGIRMTETGHRTLNGMPSMSVLKPLLQLQDETKNPKFLDFAQTLLRDWDREVDLSPNFFRNARRAEPLYSWYPQPELWAKTYEMLSCLDGLVEHGRVTGDRRSLETVKAIRDNIDRTEANAIGGLGISDRLLGAKTFPYASTELCDVIHWIRLNLDLFLATGEDRYLDSVEFSYFNAVLAGIWRDGRWATLVVRDAGRHYQSYGHCGYAYHQCCLDNAPRTFMDVASAVVTRDAKGVFHVNLYQDATVTLDGVKFVIRGDYPAHGHVAVSVSGDAEVKFRKPGWCPKLDVVRRPQAGGSVYQLDFDMNPRLCERTLEPRAEAPAAAEAVRQWGENRFLFNVDTDLRAKLPKSACASLLYGPLVLARAKRLGATRAELEDFASVNGRGCRVTLRPTEAADVYAPFEVELTTSDGKSVTTRACAYESAGDDPATKGGYVFSARW